MNRMLIGVLMVGVLMLGCTGLGIPGSETSGSSGVRGSTVLPSGLELGGATASKMVAKTGYIRVMVQQNSLEDRYAKLKTILADNGGELSSVSYDEYDAEKGYSITAKISPANFENVFAELKKLGEVKSADSNLEDVTTQYQDLNIRINNLEKELDALNALYNRTNKVDDILQIRSEINNAQTQLEIYEQQKLDLDRRVAKATINVYIYEEKPALDKNLLIPLGDLAGVFFGAMSIAITIIIGLLGFLIPGAIVGMLVYLGWKAFKRKGDVKTKPK